MADERIEKRSVELDPIVLASVLRDHAASDGIRLRVEGSSMGSSIPGGTHVYVVGSRKPRRGEVWCYVGDPGDPVVHRIRAIRDRWVIFRGDGNCANDSPVSFDRLVGKVVRSESGRKFGNVDRWRAVTDQTIRGVLRRLGSRTSASDPSS